MHGYSPSAPHTDASKARAAAHARRALTTSAKLPLPSFPGFAAPTFALALTRRGLLAEGPRPKTTQHHRRLQQDTRVVSAANCAPNNGKPSSKISNRVGPVKSKSREDYVGHHSGACFTTNARTDNLHCKTSPATRSRTSRVWGGPLLPLDQPRTKVLGTPSSHPELFQSIPLWLNSWSMRWKEILRRHVSKQHLQQRRN